MGSRMNKYYNDSKPLSSRTERNEELYQSINKNKVENYDINSNAQVLDDVPGNEVDVEKIKSILSEKYERPFRRQSIPIEEEIEEEAVTFETKDYDLNKIIEQAKAEKEADYAEDRLKKIRNTQYDILKELNLEKKVDVEEKPNPEEELLTMIKTITEKERKTFDTTDTSKELEILTDLKGSENTFVIPSLTEEQKDQYDLDKTFNANTLENSFYTDSLKVKPDDLEDFKELREEINSNSVTIKILIALFGIIVIIGLLFLFNKLFSWGIF